MGACRSAHRSAAGSGWTRPAEAAVAASDIAPPASARHAATTAPLSLGGDLGRADEHSTTTASSSSRLSAHGGGLPLAAAHHHRHEREQFTFGMPVPAGANAFLPARCHHRRQRTDDGAATEQVGRGWGGVEVGRAISQKGRTVAMQGGLAQARPHRYLCANAQPTIIRFGGWLGADMADGDWQGAPISRLPCRWPDQIQLAHALLMRLAGHHASRHAAAAGRPCGWRPAVHSCGRQHVGGLFRHDRLNHVLRRHYSHGWRGWRRHQRLPGPRPRQR